MNELISITEALWVAASLFSFFFSRVLPIRNNNHLQCCDRMDHFPESSPFHLAVSYPTLPAQSATAHWSLPARRPSPAVHLEIHSVQIKGGVWPRLKPVNIHDSFSFT